ncbi:hypothetical protein B0H17DRAFT_1217756 [Mycena rosella]|uniref:Uncharacterized protein n=1 Tax=Mycena rosella TaxID=1033263 RepID=A0AAD7BVM6_MYCRO|nr:hypothetical protein B0H17DRAFT_1217756 [Mycena rosella]
MSVPMQPFPREDLKAPDVFWDEDRSDFDGEVDEEFNEALDAVRALHSRNCTPSQPPPAAASSDSECSCKKGYWSGYSMPDNDVTSQEESAPGFSAASTHRLSRRLSRPERSRLLRTLLDAALPGDVPRQKVRVRLRSAASAPPLPPHPEHPEPAPRPAPPHAHLRPGALALPLPAPDGRPAPTRIACDA